MGDAGEEAKWWETAEEHKFALDVLQLGLRRKIMRFLYEAPMTLEEVAQKAGLKPEQAAYHLALLQKALVVDKSSDLYGLTQTGVLYIDLVEKRI